jgi:hypothetical protein
VSAVRVPSKLYPLAPDHPTYSATKTNVWVPVLNISIIHNHTETKRFETLVDSGASSCLFHSSVGRALGMDVKSGKESRLSGVIAELAGKQYFHHVKIIWMGHLIPIYAGFSEEMSTLAVLGRDGFFDNFSIHFDPCGTPAGMEIQRVYQA